MRAPFVLARDALRVERGPVLLLLAAVALTAALAFPAELLPRLGLALAPIPTAAGALPPSSLAVPPSRVQAAALADLLHILRSVGWTTVAVAALSILSLFAISGTARGRDLAIHRAVGASRRAILATLLLEALAVAAVALATGAAIGALVLGSSLRAWPGTVAGVTAWPVALGLALVAVVTIGRLLPVHVARSPEVRFRDGAEVSLAIPIVQFGVGLALVVAGVAFVRGATATASAAPSGEAPGAVLSLDAGMLATPARVRLFEAMLDAASASEGRAPSLASAGQVVGLGTTGPLTTHCGQCFRSGIFLQYVPTRAVHHLVSPDSFVAHGMPVLAGRTFTRADTLGAEPVVVVNRQMALRHFQDGDAVGRTLFLGAGMLGARYRVVGIVEDGTPPAFGAVRQPYERVYLSALQHAPAQAELLVRGADEATLERAVTAVQAVARRHDVPVSVRTERQVRATAVAPARWLARWLLAAGVALALVATLGLASAIWRWVHSLAPELGVRRSIGATRRRALALILGRALEAVLLGLGVAVITLALTLAPILAGTLRLADLWQPDALASAALAGLAVAVAAAWVPARQLLARAPARLLE